VATETIVYAPPEAGWDNGADFAAYNYFRAKKYSRADALAAVEARKFPSIKETATVPL
jgi:hypothetical protein